MTDDPFAAYPPGMDFGIAVSGRLWDPPYNPMIYASLLLVFLVTFFFRRKVDVGSRGVFWAFMVSFLVEMYGVAFSLYLVFALIGKDVAPDHFSPPGSGIIFQHYVRFPCLIIGWAVGIALIWVGWKQIHGGAGRLVKTGIYSVIRHPQYLGLIAIALGVLFFCPTFMQPILFIVLTFMYYRLARKEDRFLEERFGEEFVQYRDRTGLLIPRMRLPFARANRA